MVLFLIHRLLHASAVLLGASALVFGLVFVAGDPLAGLLPPGSSPQLQAETRQRLGLDEPLLLQYAAFLGRAARGDFGDSWRQGRPALGAVLERLPFTLALTTVALTVATACSVVLGGIAGLAPVGWASWVVRAVAALGQAVPAFWLGTLLILIFAVRLGWLPPSGFDGPRSLVLPALTLSVFPAALMTRLIRSSLLATMGDDYIRTARGKGLAPAAVVRRHAMRHALLPALGFVSVQFGFLMGGAVVIEGVFAYPGIGRLALGAVADRDLPLIQAFVMVVAVLIILAGVAVDVVARILDPRLEAGAPAGTRGR